MPEIRLFVAIVCMTIKGKLTRTYKMVNTRMYEFAKSQTDCRHFATEGKAKAQADHSAPGRSHSSVLQSTEDRPLRGIHPTKHRLPWGGIPTKSDVPPSRRHHGNIRGAWYASLAQRTHKPPHGNAHQDFRQCVPVGSRPPCGRGLTTHSNRRRFAARFNPGASAIVTFWTDIRNARNETLPNGLRYMSIRHALTLHAPLGFSDTWKMFEARFGLVAGGLNTGEAISKAANLLAEDRLAWLAYEKARINFVRLRVKTGLPKP